MRATIRVVSHRRVSSVVRGRGLLLLPVAAFAVHELRYTLAYGSSADSALASQGHSYLNSLAPWLVLLLALGAGAFLVRVARAFVSGGDDHPRRSFLGLWALASSSLVGIYVVQELLESSFAAGHPIGYAGVIGHGGWWAIVGSLVAGAAVAALLRLACEIASVAGRLNPRATFLGLAPLAMRSQALSAGPRSPLAFAAAGRAPPAA
jgi:hypothetical protein